MKYQNMPVPEERSVGLQQWLVALCYLQPIDSSAKEKVGIQVRVWATPDGGGQTRFFKEKSFFFFFFFILPEMQSLYAFY